MVNRRAAYSWLHDRMTDPNRVLRVELRNSVWLIDGWTSVRVPERYEPAIAHMDPRWYYRLGKTVLRCDLAGQPSLGSVAPEKVTTLLEERLPVPGLPNDGAEPTGDTHTHVLAEQAGDRTVWHHEVATQHSDTPLLCVPDAVASASLTRTDIDHWTVRKLPLKRGMWALYGYDGTDVQVLVPAYERRSVCA